MTNERNTKTENIFNVLQEENTKLLQEEEETPQIVKMNKDEKKVCEGKGRERIIKVQSKRKGESETGPNPGLLITTPMKGSNI